MTIKSKNKTCIECGREDQPWFSKKRCKNCASRSYKKPAKGPLRSVKYKKKLQSNKLSDFFELHEHKLAERPYCDNCGERISNPLRWSVAHILPKKKYYEVQSEVKNCVYLCAFGNNCHNIFDSIQNTEKVYEMEVWEKVYENYLEFKDKITTFGQERTILDNYKNL